ncbi:MAG: hypothetical protein M5U12_37275 [Verrucomicrobia bacterium]|nr:hypothetical protein [Verrucomicrobiota bacterium]
MGRSTRLHRGCAPRPGGAPDGADGVDGPEPATGPLLTAGGALGTAERAGGVGFMAGLLGDEGTPAGLPNEAGACWARRSGWVPARVSA